MGKMWILENELNIVQRKNVKKKEPSEIKSLNKNYICLDETKLFKKGTKIELKKHLSYYLFL